MPISGAPIGAFGDGDADVAGLAAAKKAGGDGFSDVLALQMGLDILEPRDRFGVQRDQNVSDHYAGIVSGPAGFDFQDDCGGFFLALQGLSEILGEANRLQSDSEVPVGDAAF